MQLVSLILNFLVGLTFAAQPSSSLNRLFRRDKNHEDSSLTNIYIMKDETSHFHEPLKFYTPNGSVAYQFEQIFRDVRQGISTTTVTNKDGQLMLKLASENDVCFAKSRYNEIHWAHEQHSNFTIHPRGVKADRWYFSYVTSLGEEMTYRYDRSFWNKGGKVYEYRKGNTRALVARLQGQVRWEHWLSPGSKGVPTFTLSCTPSGPQVHLVTLMGLVFTRVYECGL